MNRARLRSLLLSEHRYLNAVDEQVIVPTDGAYGEALSALDRGDAVGILGVLDAEASLKHLDDDEAAKAAATLAMCGWRPAQLGGLFHPKLSGGRPGKRLLYDAVSQIVAREKKARYDEEARRRGLRGE